jgi:hypothetical protein
LEDLFFQVFHFLANLQEVAHFNHAAKPNYYNDQAYHGQYQAAVPGVQMASVDLEEAPNRARKEKKGHRKSGQEESLDDATIKFVPTPKVLPKGKIGGPFTETGTKEATTPRGFLRNQHRLFPV